MNEIKTSGSKETPPHGAFDDYVIIESIDTSERILIRPEEFEFLTHKLFDNWRSGKSKYIQLLKEWNECIGFNSVSETPSILEDIDDTINAIQLIEGVDQVTFATLTKKDVKLILDFIFSNKSNELKIRKE